MRIVGRATDVHSRGGPSHLLELGDGGPGAGRALGATDRHHPVSATVGVSDPGRETARRRKQPGGVKLAVDG